MTDSTSACPPPPRSIHQRFEQRVPAVLVELDVEFGGHVVREVEELSAADQVHEQAYR